MYDQTHNVALASAIGEFVVSLSLDGRVLSSGSLSDALAKDRTLQVELTQDLKSTKMAEDVIDPKDNETQMERDGKLIVEEETAEGHVSWESCESVLCSWVRLTDSTKW